MVQTTPVATNSQAADNKPVGSNLNVVLTAVMLVVLLGVVGGILLYIKKKEAQSDNLL